jgi:hypothetical protein
MGLILEFFVIKIVLTNLQIENHLKFNNHCYFNSQIIN